MVTFACITTIYKHIRCRGLPRQRDFTWLSKVNYPRRPCAVKQPLCKPTTMRQKVPIKGLGYFTSEADAVVRGHFKKQIFLNIFSHIAKLCCVTSKMRCKITTFLLFWAVKITKFPYLLSKTEAALSVFYIFVFVFTLEKL